MPEDFQTMFITAGDKPALIGCSNPERIDAAKGALRDLGYKIHAATSHAEFITRFGRIRYEVVILDELFAAAKIEENQSLLALQNMAVNQRRQAVIILLGDGFKTYDPMQAFQKSVHAVINATEISMLKQITEKTLADNDLFLHNYRDVQNHIAKL
jgi:CheY-like chemotaxis protein